MKIPFNIPFFSGSEINYVADAMEKKSGCGNGIYANKCIEFLRQKFNFSNTFLVPSGTAALEMGAILSDLRPGDEVILPSYTFSSTANAIVLRGAVPIFCEIDKGTMNMNVNHLESLISKKTKMILPIDYAGIPCEIDAINSIAKKNNVTVMQDAAQSLGSLYNSNYVGNSAPLVAFSFHETKNISCGEGGALVVNDPELLERAAFVQEKGTDRSLVLKGVKNKYSWVDMGSSFLLSDILAAMLLSQLENIDLITSRRRIVCNAYSEVFYKYEKDGLLTTPQIPREVKVNNHAFFVIFDTTFNQELFLSLLRERNIHAYIGYVPLHSSPFGRKFGYSANDLPITENLAQRIVRLPLYADLQGESLVYCVENISRVLMEIYGY